MNLIKIKNVELLYWTAQVPVWINGTIVDLETTGLVPQQGDEIVAFGLAKSNRLSVFVRTHRTDYDEFLAWIRHKLIRCPRPWIAYYKDFEEMFLGYKMEFPKEWNFDIEIQPKPRWKKNRSVFFQHLNHTIDGKHIPEYWFQKNYIKVAEHLSNDLFEELALYCALSHDFRKYRHPNKRIQEFKISDQLDNR